MSSKVTSPEIIEKRIFLIRGHKIIVDKDLAGLYGVTTRRLNEQVKRNRHRFPPDFMFQLTVEEKKQVVAICDHLKTLRFSPALPHVFTEHGAIMAASVLNTKKAVEMSVFVVRAFIKLREFLSAHQELARKIEDLERVVGRHDTEIKTIVDAIRQLMAPPPEPPKRKIGFVAHR
ncbi:MAG: ORF6N domain-containing protein [Candidatus Omnitrophota bacterium]|nr:ORF6N domain-containing protein [Candidatus Omnitrophota bacterium]